MLATIVKSLKEIKYEITKNAEALCINEVTENGTF